jgi:hypothetical protein
MAARLALLLLLLVLASPLAAGQVEPAPDGTADVLQRLEVALRLGEFSGLAQLLDPATPPEEFDSFAADLLHTDVVRVLVNERDRSPLAGAPQGSAYRLVVEMFIETKTRARIVTVLMDLRRPLDGAPGEWRITGARGLTSVEGLYRLQLDTSARYAARDLRITATDLEMTLREGFVYTVSSDAGITGLVLVGRGVLLFTPPSATEQGQVRTFAGSNALTTEFETAFVRFHPSEYEGRVSVDRLVPAPPDVRQQRRVRELFERESPKSFNLDLRELSPVAWHMLPQPGDFLAEIHTRRHGALTYSRSLSQVEDVTLFDRNRQRTISLYPSPERAAALATVASTDVLREYDILDYDIDLTVSPEREHIEGRARVRLNVRAEALSTITLRLADDLVVTSVTSPELGRLLHFRLRGQNNLIVNLPIALERDTQVTLVVAYRGQVMPQAVDDEALQTGESGGGELNIMTEPYLLLSGRALWYPQSTGTDYATATLRLTVPEGYGCVASGDPRREGEVTLRDLLTLTRGKAFVFTGREPLRYLAFIVSRFIRVAESTIEVADRAAPGGMRSMRLTVDANPRQQGLGRNLLGDFQAVVRFYANILGDAPYESGALALVEHELPGGHSPGYFAVLNSQIPGGRSTWHNDPAAFSGFPEFFLAHELAHQWWGQAVGWRNYHEQWLSEGFAQYFAALYARQARGERVFRDMLRQFNRWAIAESDEGPISLGYRLGQIKAQPRVFRAIVYNKGAAVLHMLRQLVGDDAFFAALRRFYVEHKFRTSDTAALRAIFEAESGRSLARFFDQWVEGTELPRIRYARSVSPGMVALRFEQQTEQVFDVPVTVTLTYVDGRSIDMVVPITEREVVWSVPTRGAVRQVQVNRDFGAVARFDEE